MKFLILNSKFLKHYLKAKKKGIDLFTKAVQRCPLEIRVREGDRGAAKAVFVKDRKTWMDEGRSSLRGDGQGI